ncbi:MULTISPECIES: glycosyltransferase family 2 protein [Rhodomicrobium]|uniref:glycosyltransferase n=1 Tax=Rhodomicrobium TaxID=1068 RepID=UPI000B4AD443|nr:MULTISPECIES: glycosyltransferase family 2 protein [Rhodomicrobium]
MWAILEDGFTYLNAQSVQSFIALFWFVILFELPRYTLTFLTAGVLLPFHTPDPASRKRPRVTAVVAGHNEADVIERCVMAMHEQTWPPDEIIVVSDGSTDNMADKLRGLRKRGLITAVHSTHLRAGKSAATNLAVRGATGDIIINIDCDCTLDRHAFEHVCAPFADPAVGAVAGNIVVRNPDASFIAGYQSIEYLVILSLGKRGCNLTDQVVCASGAFGAFRKSALDDVGGLDAGGGEDLDLTLRIRKAGWKVRFVSEAICYTDVPETFSAFIRQRFRWERDALRQRYRKHKDQVSPLSLHMQPLELAHQLEFLIFDVGAAIAMPIYLVWLFVTYGDTAPAILIAAQAGMLVLDLLTLCLAAIATPQVLTLRHLLYMPAYSVLNSYFMRFVRLAAYCQEWFFDASYKDSYVPAKVHLQRF